MKITLLFILIFFTFLFFMWRMAQLMNAIVYQDFEDNKQITKALFFAAILSLLWSLYVNLF